MAFATALMSMGVTAGAATSSSVHRLQSVMNGLRIRHAVSAMPEKKNSAVRFRAPRAGEKPLMCPKWEIYFYNDNGWTQIGRSDYEYDGEGHPVRIVVDDEGLVYTLVMEYDDYGQQTLALTLDGAGENVRNQSKRTYVYDPVVHDFYTERMGYDWNGSDWQSNYFCETNEVTRNEAGNITDIIKSLPYQGKMMPAYHYEWGYDDPADHATSCRYYMNMGGTDESWILYNDTEYADIKWNRTDGQLTGDILEMIEGRNRLSSATVYYDDEPDGYILVSYPEGDEQGYKMVMTTNNPEEIGIIQQLEQLEADVLTLRYTVSEYIDPDTDEITSEPTYQFTNITAYDNHGNVTYSENYEMLPGEEPELVSGEKYAHTYDADGNLTETVQSVYYYDDGEYVEEGKTEYGDYIDVAAGVVAINAGDGSLRIVALEAVADASISVYAADGRIVASGYGTVDLSPLQPGSYIIRSGAESLKFMR